MTLSDQIDEVTRRGLGDIVAATQRYIAEQDRLRAALAEHAADAPEQRLRADLEQRAQAADSPTPRLLLPAQMAHASPHGAGGGGGAS